jgi:predicted secreted protein
MRLGEQDSSRTVEVGAGSVITVALAENPTTGYRWTVETAGGLERIGDRSEGGGGFGAASMRVFEFRASQAGSHTLRLKNWREWEGESSVIKRFEAQILVK